MTSSAAAGHGTPPANSSALTPPALTPPAPSNAPAVAPPTGAAPPAVPATDRNPLVAGAVLQHQRLVALLAEFKARSSAITSRNDQERSATTQTFKTAIAATDQTLLESLQSLTTTRDGDLQTADAALKTATASADRGLSKSKAAVEESAMGLLGSAKKKHNDRVWMADSLFDNCKHRPRLAHEALDKQLKARRIDLQVVREQLAEFMKRCNQGPLPAVTAEPATAPAIARPEPTQAELVVQAERSKPIAPPEADEIATEAQRAAEKYVSLSYRMGPRLAVSGVAVLLAALIGIGAAVGGLALRGWTFEPLVAAIGVGGAVLAFAALFMLGRSVRASTQAAAADVLKTITGAEAQADAMAQASEARRAAQEGAVIARRAGEIDTARAEFVELDRTVRAEAKAKLDTLIGKLQQAQAEAKATYSQSRAAIEKAFADAQQTASATHQMATTTAHANRDQAIRQLDAWLGTESTTITADWTAAVDTWQRDSHALCDAVDAANPAWETLVETNGQASTGRSLGSKRLGGHPIKVGSIELSTRLAGGLPDDSRLPWTGPQTLRVPLSLMTPTLASLLVQAPPEGRHAGIAVIQAAALRALLTLPPAKTRFVLIDPVGLGQSFAGLMHLADYQPQLVADRIWTETRHIEQRLIDLTEHMEMVIQKYLRNEFADIEKYNEFAGEVAEPYRFLIIADFPAGMNEASAQRLKSIIESGPRCGVYTFMLADPRAKLPGAVNNTGAALSMADIERASLTIAWRKDRFVLQNKVLSALPLEVQSPPDDDLFRTLVHQAGTQAKQAGTVQVPIEMVMPTAAQIWTGDSTREFRLPLGRLGASKLQYLTLGKGTAQHALIAGRTGSGKSTLMNVVITAAALWFSPSQVELYLIDFKKGVEFRAYAVAKLPHAKVVAIESEREFGLSVLRKLDDELRRRGELFRMVGAQDLAAFRKERPSEHMPRCLLIIDEFQEIFSEDDKLSQEASLLLDRLVRQGRAFGMHVILGSQTLAGAYSLARSTIGQMAVRIALQCTEADSYLILSEDNAAARLLSRPGEAIYNDASGMLEGNSPFQIAWLADEQRQTFLAMARSETDRRNIHAPGPIVFEGSKPADLSDNHLLSELEADNAPTVEPITTRAWLGEPVSIKDPTSAVFRRQAGHNLLVIGQRDETGAGILAAAVRGLLAQHPMLAPHPELDGTGGLKRITLLDGTPQDSPVVGALMTEATRVARNAMEIANIDYRAVAEAINALGDELQRRMDADATDAPSLYLVINGLQRYRMLRKSEDDFGMGASLSSFGDPDAPPPAPKPDQTLVKLLREGPNFGIFTLAWCDTVVNLERTLPRGLLKEFDQRAVMQMSQTDSSTLIDSPVAGNLGQHRMLLAIESQGTTEKFRPYQLD